MIIFSYFYTYSCRWTFWRGTKLQYNDLDYINITIHLRSTMTKSANKIISTARKDMKHIQNVLNRLLQISAKIKKNVDITTF